MSETPAPPVVQSAPPAPPTGTPTLPRLQVVAAAILFSTGGTVIKVTSLTGMQVAALRSGVAALAILALSRDARRGWTWRTPLVGLVSALTLILFVSSNKLTTAANAIFLQSTAPLYLLLLSPLLLREPVHRRDLVPAALLALGVLAFFLAGEPARGTATDPPLGNLLAAASGLTWAFTIAGLRWLARAAPRAQGGGAAVPATVAGNLLGCLACLPFAFPVARAGPVDAAAILFLGVFQIALAYLCLTASVKRVPAFEGALLLLLEPVASTLIAWAAHGEQPGPGALLGMGVILAATLLHAGLEARAFRARPA